MPAQAFPQSEYSTQRPAANDSLYIRAIAEYTVALSKEPQRSIGDNVQPKTLYLARCTYLFDLPEVINGYRVMVLWPSQHARHLKENNGRLVILDLLPLAFENGQFSIDIKQAQANTLTALDHLDWNDGGLGVTSFFDFKNGKMVFDHAKVTGAFHKK
ncbi:hypothetical protein HYN48_01265 [Flavobacterium magnum]|uniref:Uncharacterized protein n=2 Tax=Flavobacterium magnum TaxID=2162713 RepID=A0A2S0R9Y4_9FLAO|nr:hypothetical protein HYN48_01265 [Flavobacterium magnum]